MRALAFAAAVGLLAVLASPQNGWAKSRFASQTAPVGFSPAKGLGGAGFHPSRLGHGRPWRRVPLYLDGDRGRDVIVTIRQVIAPTTIVPAVMAVPSLADLPASAGIRQTRPAEAAVYVLNEGAGPASRRLSHGGPKILSAAPANAGAWSEAEAHDVPFGARIIHLTVPVGGS